MSAVPDWHRATRSKASPEERECTAIAAPSHPKTMASADASRHPNEHPSWLRGDDRTSSALLLALEIGRAFLAVYQERSRGTRMLIRSLSCYRVPDTSTDHPAVCATMRQVPDLQ